MRILRGVWTLGLMAFLVPSLALGSDFDKTVPLHPNELSHYRGEQLFEAAFQAYVCSFLMHLAEQKAKAQVLRWYSVKLMQENRVKEYGKNWNDVNFPGSLTATTLSDQYAERFSVTRSAAAGRLLNDPQCKALNRFTKQALKNHESKSERKP